MHREDNEDSLLRSVALKNAQAVLAAQQKHEQALVDAKQALEWKTGELAHSLAMMRATLEATTDAILLTDGEGNVVDFNDKYARLWGFAENGTIEPLADMHFTCQAKCFEDPQAYLLRARRIQCDRAEESFDILHFSDGRIIERSSRAQIVSKRNVGRVWTFHDVTRQLRIESALREEGRILELLNKTGAAIASTLDLSSLLQMVTDATTELSGAKFGAFFYNSTGPDGNAYQLYTLSGAPKEAFEKFGYPRDTAVFSPTFHGRPPIRCDDILLDPRYGKSSPHYGMPKGHLPVRSYLAVPVAMRSGEVIGGLFFGHPEPGVFTERSERLVVAVAAQAAVALENARLYQRAQEAAAERARLLESERAARMLAEQQNQAKDTFLAMLGHELRNPLSAISAGVAVVGMSGVQSDASSRAFDVIARQSKHLERIVDDLLDAARMLSGKITLKTEEVRLDEAIAACLHAFDTSGRSRQHEVTVQAVPATVQADPARIDQVISNLLTNAFKYSPPGSKVCVLLESRDADAVLTVSDNGMGIPAELIDRIFDPFVQGPRAIDRAQGGLGIGLTMVRRLVELHGGHVEVASDGAGQGARFTVRFPLASGQELEVYCQ